MQQVMVLLQSGVTYKWCVVVWVGRSVVVVCCSKLDAWSGAGPVGFGLINSGKLELYLRTGNVGMAGSSGRSGQVGLLVVGWVHFTQVGVVWGVCWVAVACCACRRLLLVARRYVKFWYVENPPPRMDESLVLSDNVGG